MFFTINMDTAKVPIGVFDGTGYAPWKMRMTNLLIEKDLWTIDEDPATTINEVLEENKAKMVLPMIKRFMSEEIVDQVKSCSTVKMLFETLDTLYMVNSFSKRFVVQNKIHNLWYSGNRCDWAEHLRTLDALFGELQAAGGKVTEEEKVMRLLLTVAPSMHPWITTILDVLPEEKNNFESMGKIIGDYMDRRIERQNTVQQNILPSPAAARPEPLLWCIFCLQTGHKRRDCVHWKKPGKGKGSKKAAKAKRREAIEAKKLYKNFCDGRVSVIKNEPGTVPHGRMPIKDERQFFQPIKIKQEPPF